MKKIVLIILSLAVVVSLTSCGENKKEEKPVVKKEEKKQEDEGKKQEEKVKEEKKKQEEKKQEEKKKPEKENKKQEEKKNQKKNNSDIDLEQAMKNATPIKVGDVIKANNLEITINKIEFSRDVEPDKKGEGMYRHFPADEGKVLIHIDTDAKNLQKEPIKCSRVMNAVVNYNNGTEFKAYAVAEDDDGLGLTYANIRNVEPSKTRGIKYLFDCPEEVEKNKEASLVIIFKVGEKFFSYKMK